MKELVFSQNFNTQILLISVVNPAESTLKGEKSKENTKFDSMKTYQSSMEIWTF